MYRVISLDMPRTLSSKELICDGIFVKEKVQVI